MTWIAIWVQVFNISEKQMILGDTHLRIPHLQTTKDKFTWEKMLPSEQGINIPSCPQNQSCALLNSDLLTINTPFVLVNGISNPLCKNLAEFSAAQ